MRWVLVLAVLAVGCGDTEAPKEAAKKTVVATPTPTPSLEPTGDVGEKERATMELQDFLVQNTQAAATLCSPLDEEDSEAIAIYDCDYADGVDGRYFLFKSRAALRDYYKGIRTLGEPVGGSRCGEGTWDRGDGKDQGQMGLYRIVDGHILVWTDESEHVAGIIDSRTVSKGRLCSLWLKTG